MRLIDADALLERMKKDPLFPLVERYGVSGVINAEPTVEPKTGRWISHSVGHEHIPWGFDCSNCGKWIVIGKDTIEEYNFCPNCGADMRGKKK